MQDEEMLIEELGNQLAESFYQTIQVLSSMISIREKYFEGSHSRWVAHKSAQVALKLGLSEDEIFEIEIAGMLHDIGKIGLKETILAKYTNEMLGSEFRTYSMHPELGRQILNKHDGFRSISEIIYQHHERLDGSGFPNHLMGKEINPGAAIIAVTDAFNNLFYKRQKIRLDSSTSPLHYTNISAYIETTKDRYNSTMNYLHQKSGILFDTKVVQLFTDIIDIERRAMGQKTVMRLPISKIEGGMIFAEDYYTSLGLLIVARGEVLNDDMKSAMIRFAEAGELPPKILIMK